MPGVQRAAARGPFLPHAGGRGDRWEEVPERRGAASCGARRIDVTFELLQ